MQVLGIPKLLSPYLTNLQILAMNSSIPEMQQIMKMAKPSANENPNIPINGAIPPIVADSTNNVPTIGPVHEKETKASANAMKKIPIIPPLSEA